MCGITGFIDYTKLHGSGELDRMTDSLLHRGPDDRGVLFKHRDNYHLGFGQRRLSIIDLSPSGHQPMEAFGRTIVFNGEMYNYRDVRKDLEDKGYQFTGNSDTEVLLTAFEAWGNDCIHRFIGMFAFTLYDKRTDIIYLYRDRAGVKPLYYYWDGSVLLFASELKSFFASPHYKRRIDMKSLAGYIQFGYVQGSESIMERTKKVLPGHYISLNLKSRELESHCYWSVENGYNKQRLVISEDEAADEMDRLFHSAFGYRMVSDVPVGMFLSGGYDSSTVAAVLQSQMSTPLKTFTIGFKEKGYDEAPWAKKIAEHLGTDHTEYYCTQREAAEIIPTLPEIYDEPFGDSSAIPTILVSRVARQDVTVSLSADAGDEIFGGYGKHSLALSYYRNFSRYPGFVRRGGASLLNSGLLDSIPGISGTYNYQTRLKKVSELLSAGSIGEYLEVISKDFPKKEAMALFPEWPDTRENLFSADKLLDPEINDLLSRILAVDYKTYLPDDILTKVDRATMSVSLEGREPLLDHRILEFAAQLSSDYKIRSNSSGLGSGKSVQKYLLKKIAHRYLPQELMDRPKMGFGVPIVQWFRDELKDYFMTYLDFSRLKSEGIFNPEPIIKLRDRYMAGRQENVQKLWYLLMFEMWYEKWMK